MILKSSLRSERQENVTKVVIDNAGNDFGFKRQREGPHVGKLYQK